MLFTQRMVDELCTTCYGVLKQADMLPRAVTLEESVKAMKTTGLGNLLIMRFILFYMGECIGEFKSRAIVESMMPSPAKEK